MKSRMKESIQESTNKFIQFCNEDITEKQFKQGKRQYILTDKDINEMQNRADKELFSYE